MSTFDEEAFMEQSNEGEFATETAKCPEGTWHAQVTERPKAQTRTVNGEDRIVVTVPWHVLDEEVAEEMEMDRPMVFQDLWIDLDENGKLDNSRNKNVQLGRILEAFELNGKKWSWDDFVDREATIRVAHRKGYARVVSTTAYEG